MPRPVVRSLLLPGGFLLAGLAASGRFLFLDGWPHNHDGLAGFQRVEVFRLAFLSGDLFPVWTPLAQNGFGSAFPFFYHRLFNSLAALLSLVFGSTFAGVRASVPLLLAAGGLGMARLLLAMNLPPLLATGGGVLLVFANYTYQDWLVRGAFAEFAAFMLVPWMLLAALKTARGDRGAGAALGAALALLFFAHSAVFLFALPMLAIFFAVVAAGALEIAPDRWRLARSLAVAAAVTGAIAGPSLAGMALFRYWVSLDALSQKNLDVFRNFEPLGRYFVDFERGGSFDAAAYSVEIGRGFNSAAIVLFLLAAVLVARRRISRESLRGNGAAWALVLVVGGLALALQTPLGGELFRLPGARYASFPWRLLVFATPASIAFLALTVDLLRSASRPAARAAFAGVFAAAVLFQVMFGLTTPLASGTYTRAEVDASLRKETLAAGFGFSGEYLPPGIALPPPRPFLGATGCRVVSVSPPDVLRDPVEHPEFRAATEAVESSESCRVSIRQFANPFLDVDAGPVGRVSTAADGSILIEPGPGRRDVALRRRGLVAALVAELRGRPGGARDAARR